MSKITKSAKGQQCTVMIPAVCNFDPATTVFAHLNGGGLGMKQKDLFGAYCCSACHAWLDGGYARTTTRDARDLEHLRAMKKTQELLIEQGLICVC